MIKEYISIRGAREHNLKDISLEIPRNKLIVITGLSGSGKSSLAFDTIYAEGQRRYVESLSAYARQFLEIMEKPDVDFIEGLSPAIAIQQRSSGHNPRSTVGTVTEIYDYLRLLFARVGVPHCPACGRKVSPRSAQQIIDELMKQPEGSKIQILSPIVRGRIGTYQELFERLRKLGYVRARVNGKVYGLEEDIKLDRYKKHNIEIIVDRLTVFHTAEGRQRLADSVETALRESRGLLLAIIESKEILYSEKLSCPFDGTSLPDLEPRTFSFNSPYGACPECSGLGTKLEIDRELVVPNTELSVLGGALKPWSTPITTRTHRWKYAWSSYYGEMLEGVASTYNLSLDKPFNKLTDEQQQILLYGKGDFEGVITNLERRYRETESDYVKEEIYNEYITRRTCPVCGGKRLKKEVLAITISGKSIADVAVMSVGDAALFFDGIKLAEKEKLIAKQVLKEINQRLKFLNDVGLDYITLDRESSTLAGGEAQRIHLATQIGSGLTGVLYVLDEPTIGLHQRDNKRLLSTLASLRDLGNTLIVVEHDEETIRSADWIVDLGPGAGVHGGEVVASGPLKKILQSKQSLTGKYLRGKLRIPVPAPEARRKPKDKYLEITGATQFNLKNIDVKFPLGLFIGITGISGSGKSTLIYEILYKALARRLYKAKEIPGRHRLMKGIENIDKVIIVDQAPIGRTPRSNPATYTGVFGPIRELFSKVPEARKRGYGPGRFSFNVKGGRCENCQGGGVIKIEMQFLPDVYVKCDVCGGRRFNEETLQIKFKNRNISEVLNMPVEEALKFFKDIPYISRILKTLDDVGLGYIQLGQSATTLSGGEAQRVKLASELHGRSTGKTLYLLDEPTTGLHFADVEKLLSVLHRIVDRGNTVIIIEHNLEVIKTADWLIDLGPEGGEKGGYVVSEGPPEKIVLENKSYTGGFLKHVIRKGLN